MNQTEIVPIESLVFDPANARKHDDKNLSSIKGSLARFKQQKPIVVSKDNIVLAGNGTLSAMLALGHTEVWISRSELTGVEAVAYSLADNRTAELGTWDDDILGKTLHALQEDGFPIADIGFDVGDWGVEPEEKENDDTVTIEKFSIAVILENSEDQEELFLELRDRGFKVKVI